MQFSLIGLALILAVFKLFYLLGFSLVNIGEYSLYGHFNSFPQIFSIHVPFFVLSCFYSHDKVLLNLNFHKLMSQLAPFVQRVDCAAHYMNHYPLDPIARDLSSGQQSYFEQLHGT